VDFGDQWLSFDDEGLARMVGSLERGASTGVLWCASIDQRFVERPGETFVVEGEPLVAEVHVMRSRANTARGTGSPAAGNGEGTEEAQKPVRRRLYTPGEKKAGNRLYVPKEEP